MDEARLIEAFWARVDRKGPDDCWEWQGKPDVNGYGRVRWNGNGCRVQAHRKALALSAGEQPSKFALHSCDNKACCNPAHLRWGTTSENIRDAFERNTEFRRKVIAMGKSKKPTRKLCDSQVAYMKMLLNHGFSQRQCAKWYCVCKSVVGRIATGKFYAEVKPWQI